MKLINVIKKILSPKILWGFISPSVYLDAVQVRQAKDLIENEDESYIMQFEKQLSEELGGGKVTAFASGRMAFYAILQSLGIQKGDEIILTGFTCSVMVNAVVRCGATPVYVDIDADTLGTSPESLRKCITSATKVIVAQHSFGIPCRIDEIQKIARGHHIFLVEDCALSFLSSYKGVILGNWGDAAIFSTDHTKPMNTLIGGFAYTHDRDLNEGFHNIYNQADSLSKGHCEKILAQYIKENKLERVNHKLFIIRQYWGIVRDKLHLGGTYSPYLLNDSFSEIKQESYYPYPAKMPSFLAYIGLSVLDEYIRTIQDKKEFLDLLLNHFKDADIVIPKMYFYSLADIVPLRFCFLCNDANRLKKLRSRTDGWIWFQAPIISTVDSLSSFGYQNGCCPIAEQIGGSIMNLPIPEKVNVKNKLINKFKKYI
ncbi:MAG: DegT/DnrJ/EryC1/StrS family aminotransferase [Odoribacter sp.]